MRCTCVDGELTEEPKRCTRLRDAMQIKEAELQSWLEGHVRKIFLV